MSRTVNISFRLRETGAAKPTPITCLVEYKGKPVVKIPTGTKVHPAKCNAEKERPIGGLKGLKSAEANAIIEKLATVHGECNYLQRTWVSLLRTSGADSSCCSPRNPRLPPPLTSLLAV